MKLYTLLAADTGKLFSGPEDPTNPTIQTTGVTDVYIIGFSEDSSTYLVLSKTAYPELNLVDIENIPYIFRIAYPCDKGGRVNKDMVYRLWEQMRKDNYPPIENYIDGVVKNDTAQIQEYIDACNAVKEMFPKIVV